MFAMIFVSGLQSLFREKLDGRNSLIVALAIGIGVGIGNVPEALGELQLGLVIYLHKMV